MEEGAATGQIREVVTASTLGLPDATQPAPGQGCPRHSGWSTLTSQGKAGAYGDPCVPPPPASVSAQECLPWLGNRLSLAGVLKGDRSLSEPQDVGSSTRRDCKQVWSAASPATYFSIFPLLGQRPPPSDVPLALLGWETDSQACLLSGPSWTLMTSPCRLQLLRLPLVLNSVALP